MQLFEQLIAETYAQWDRGHMATCVCAAEIGAYKSAEQCFDLLRSGPDWASCSAMAVADLNSPELRERTRELVRAGGGELRVSSLQGDVRRLHTQPLNNSALFQVASQFNLLEMTGPDVTPEA